jgi:hypothetical protein
VISQVGSERATTPLLLGVEPSAIHLSGITLLIPICSAG